MVRRAHERIQETQCTQDSNLATSVLEETELGNSDPTKDEGRGTAVKRSPSSKAIAPLAIFCLTFYTFQMGFVIVRKKMFILMPVLAA